MLLSRYMPPLFSLMLHASCYFDRFSIRWCFDFRRWFSPCCWFLSFSLSMLSAFRFSFSFARCYSFFILLLPRHCRFLSLAFLCFLISSSSPCHAMPLLCCFFLLLLWLLLLFFLWCLLFRFAAIRHFRRFTFSRCLLSFRWYFTIFDTLITSPTQQYYFNTIPTTSYVTIQYDWWLSFFFSFADADAFAAFIHNAAISDAFSSLSFDMLSFFLSRCHAFSASPAPLFAFRRCFFCRYAACHTMILMLLPFSLIYFSFFFRCLLMLLFFAAITTPIRRFSMLPLHDAAAAVFSLFLFAAAMPLIFFLSFSSPLWCRYAFFFRLRLRFLFLDIFFSLLFAAIW